MKKGTAQPDGEAARGSGVQAVNARSKVLTKAIVRVAAQLGLAQNELAAVIGISAPTVSRMFAGHWLLQEDTKSWELAALLVRAFRSLDALVGGNEKQVKQWFRAENVHLGGAPKALVASVEGLTNVARYLDAMRGASRVSAFAGPAWRVVEAQHRVSIRRLVDTLDEQALLEQIVDEVKPPRPRGSEFDRLHYLLSTPFRHPPLLRGSRFGAANERSVWYGARQVETSLAEKAYYQLLFVDGTRAELENVSCDWTAFRVDVQTDAAVDLTAPPFDRFRRQISSPTSYAATRRLGRAMRAAGVVAFLFTSARCPRKGTVVGLFSPAFASKSPGAFQTWKCLVTGVGCEVVHLNGARPPLVFSRTSFEIDGRIPAPSAE